MYRKIERYDEFSDPKSEKELEYLLTVVNNYIKMSVPLNRMHGDPLETPLHLAASRGFVPICKLLLRNGADVNTKEIGSDRPPPLVFCIRILGYVASVVCEEDIQITEMMVRLFLEYGADVSEKFWSSYEQTCKLIDLSSIMQENGEVSRAVRRIGSYVKKFQRAKLIDTHLQSVLSDSHAVEQVASEIPKIVVRYVTHLE